MKTRYLFPFKYKKFGWILFLLGLIFGVVFKTAELESSFWNDFLTIKVFPLIGENPEWKNSAVSLTWSKHNIFDELISILIIIGGLIVAFSKSKHEDEYIAKIRMESLIWATYVNYGILVLSVVFIYGGPFLDVMIYNMFTILIFFVIRFHFMLYKTKRQLRHEE